MKNCFKLHRAPTSHLVKLSLPDFYFSQRDFVEALCMKERELDDTRIAQKEAQRLCEEQKKLANQLQHKISSVGQSFEKFFFRVKLSSKPHATR